MGGVVSGSSILNTMKESDSVMTLSLTVNNECNLQCPHCYLQIKKDTALIDIDLLKHVFEQEFDHLAIVGMEPLFDRRTASHTLRIAATAKKFGKTVSVITNGFGLQFLGDDDCELFDSVDVSFDGGRNSYFNSRGASFEKLVRVINAKTVIGPKLSILNTITQENASQLEDMLALSEHIAYRQMMFSPFLSTNSEGKIDSNELSLVKILQILGQSQAFFDDEKSFFFADKYHLDHEQIELSELCLIIQQLNFGAGKVRTLKYSPLVAGNVRLTFDGKFISPFDALHTATYNTAVTFDAWTTPLADAYSAFRHNERGHIRPRLIAAE